MSTVATPAPAAAAPNRVIPRHVLIIGRVENVEIINAVRYTTVICPATDEYSSPEYIQIRSKRSMGTKGDQLQQWCRLGGFRGKPFDSKDKDTGEIIKKRQVLHTVDAIED